MQFDDFAPAPLDPGHASSLLHDAWIVDDESSRSVLAACTHRVLVLEVATATTTESAYRNTGEGAPRLLVGTFEPLRRQYLLTLEPGALAWEPGEPPEWLQDRVDACLAAEGLKGARITAWAEEEVAEIQWGSPPGKGSSASSIVFVGTSPARRVGHDRVPLQWAPMLVGATLFAGAYAMYMAAIAHHTLTDRGVGAFILFQVGVWFAMTVWFRRRARPPSRIAAAR